MADRKEIIDNLKESYRMEIETVMNYLSNSVNLDGVIAAEEAAIDQYNKIIKLCDGVDYVTQDLCIRNWRDEETHRIEFIGFSKEYRNQISVYL